MLYLELNILYSEVNIVCSEVNMMFILIFDISVNNIVQFTVFHFSEVYCAYSELYMLTVKYIEHLVNCNMLTELY